MSSSDRVEVVGYLPFVAQVFAHLGAEHVFGNFLLLRFGEVVGWVEHFYSLWVVVWGWFLTPKM